MIEEDAQLSEPSVETAPAETTSDAEIRQTMSAAFDKAQSSSPNDEFSRVPSENFTQYQPADETDHSESATNNADNANTDYPPQSWKSEMHPVWSQLPPEAKEYINQREVEMTRAITKFGETASRASQVSERIGQELEVATEIGKVVESYRDFIPRRSDGQLMPPHAVLQELLKANQVMTERPADAIRHLAQYYNVDLAQLAQAPVDPVEQIQTQARQEIERARHEERQALHAQLRQAQEQQQAAHEQQVTDHVMRFASEKPYWNSIESTVHYHIAALRSVYPDASPMQILQEAHDRALREHSDLDPRQQEKSKAELAERVRKADQARRLASMNIRSKITSSASPGPTNTDMTQTMTSIYERIHGR